MPLVENECIPQTITSGPEPSPGPEAYDATLNSEFNQ